MASAGASRDAETVTVRRGALAAGLSTLTINTNPQNLNKKQAVLTVYGGFALPAAGSRGHRPDRRHP